MQLRNMFGAVLMSTVFAMSNWVRANEAPPDSLRLIETSPGVRAWMNEGEISELSHQSHERGRCGGFFDVTENQNPMSLYLELPGALDNRIPRHENDVLPRLAALSPDNLMETVKRLSAFHNRYYKSQTGVQSMKWIRDQLHEHSKNRTDVSVDLIQHSFLQPSVVARIAGKGNLADETVILGGHGDSINWQFGLPSATSKAPGADDNASGVATLLETFRVLMQSGFRPERTVEFMIYAGEERGLLGSQDIARRYQDQGRKVVAVLQLDMTLFPGKNGPAIHLINDNVNRSLTDFLALLIDHYVKVPWREMKCGYACSDHASWDRLGYPAAFPFEAEMNDSNPRIHGAQDTAEILDAAFGLHFAKLATAFAVELSRE